MKIGEIITFLEEKAPRYLQESYDNAGYITGQADMTCTGVMCCLDSTEAVIEEAISKKCNLVIAHHPIIFSGLKSITGQNYIERVIILAIKNNIAIYAIHTNLDNVLIDGVNTKLAHVLDLEVIGALRPKIEGRYIPPKNSVLPSIADGARPNQPSALIGSGLLTRMRKPMAEMDFLVHVKQKLGCDCIKYTPLLNKKVQKVAICGGSGRFLVPDAIAHGADVFITADIKYHEYFDANAQIVLADVGHFESEQFTSELLHDMITEKFRNFAVFKTTHISNPIKYLT